MNNLENKLIRNAVIGTALTGLIGLGIGAYLFNQPEETTIEPRNVVGLLVATMIPYTIGIVPLLIKGFRDSANYLFERDK